MSPGIRSIIDRIGFVAAGARIWELPGEEGGVLVGVEEVEFCRRASSAGLKGARPGGRLCGHGHLRSGERRRARGVAARHGPHSGCRHLDGTGARGVEDIGAFRFLLEQESGTRIDCSDAELDGQLPFSRTFGLAIAQILEAKAESGRIFVPEREVGAIDVRVQAEMHAAL